ncbi:MAG: hypothetical protein M3077_05800 [Candidatus Dormibacteraeota bacterium]|nr:hypothetical protein [Candidatus Dormibacteraeota bacterium]
MTTRGTDQTVEEAIRLFNRPVRFREIAAALAENGVTKSQVHNAVYRLGKKGRLQATGAGSATSYSVADRR